MLRVESDDPRTRRILVVEDDEDTRTAMSEALSVAGFEVFSAASGVEGLRTLAERSVDAVVTDLGMPGMGGLEVVRAARKIAPTVPVVVVTGSAEDAELRRARGREVDVVLAKPVDPATLLAALDDVVQARGR